MYLGGNIGSMIYFNEIFEFNQQEMQASDNAKYLCCCSAQLDGKKNRHAFVWEGSVQIHYRLTVPEKLQQLPILALAFDK